VLSCLLQDCCVCWRLLRLLERLAWRSAVLILLLVSGAVFTGCRAVCCV